LRKINGFYQCTSLYQIEIPSSVEVIGMPSFAECTSLAEVIFSSESHLLEIDGFQECASLSRIEIPSSVEVIESHSFYHCSSLRVIVIGAECRLRDNSRLQKIKPFLVYRDEDVKESRRLFHLGIGGRRKARRTLWQLC
jgi:hypothetical protein